MKKPFQFVILVCAVSWTAAWLVLTLLDLRLYSGILPQIGTKGAAYTAFAAAYMLLPAVCAAALQIVHGERPFHGMNVSFRLNRWFIIAGIVPFVYSFMALGINLLFPNVSLSIAYEGYLARIAGSLTAQQMELVTQQLSRFPPAVFLLIQIANAIIAAYTINAVFGLGEELGWRGYLLSALKGRKFLPASLIIGVVWGLWHFPLILVGHNYPQHPAAGVGMMVVYCVLLTPMMVYIVIKSKSVITAAIFHGANNAIAGIAVLYVVGGSDITNGVTGIAGFIALLVVNVGFYIYDRYVTRENIFTSVIGGDNNKVKVK